MFKRFRQLRISLAAKCQILFGAAVLLIIGAALAVPWHRMEQLTEELNERAAAAVAENTLAEHMRNQREGVARDLTTEAPAAPEDPAAPRDDDRKPISPRIISLNREDEAGLNRFEKYALGHLKRHPDHAPYTAYYARKDNSEGFRFAQPVYLTRDCAACHGAPSEATTAPALTEAAAAPIYPLAMERPSRLVGMVSLDITSRIQQNQLLLNRAFILFAGLLAGFLAIVTFYFITTRLILQPVRVLQETAEKVSQGDLNIRSDISTGDEFQQLAETFNTMLANLKQGADQLRAINKGLDMKLGQLAESNLALYESNRLKSEFLANVSHELRTPLNSILGFADLLKDALPGGPETRTARYVHNILQSGKNLLDLINDLLDLAKIEAGKMDIRSEPISLGDLFEGLANILKPLTEVKSLTLTTAVAPDVPIVRTDPGKLQQILYNFLSNAIKFSPDAAAIDLIAQREGEDNVRITVVDRGPGIPPDKQEVIFEKFRQVDASHTRTHGGTGLGLAISKELTTLLNGSIGVRSTTGQGSAFWVVIPLKIEAGAMDMRGRLVMA
ncbi:MAG: putative two-component system sensor histidine kinase [Phycisphaerales bacterium]|nr:putative two-component system sensor histidine kinase [Phycisphaerales bacterium]